MSDTPRTDAFAEAVHEGQCLDSCDSFAHDEKCPVCFGAYLIADFARTLERELSDMREARDEWIAGYHVLQEKMNGAAAAYRSEIASHESALAEVAKERDKLKASEFVFLSCSLHAMFCIHHTDAERAANTLGGNCPICNKAQIKLLKAERDAALAEQKRLNEYYQYEAIKLTKCREALKKCSAVLHYHADKPDAAIEDVETFAIAREALEETK